MKSTSVLSTSILALLLGATVLSGAQNGHSRDHEGGGPHQEGGSVHQNGSEHQSPRQSREPAEHPGNPGRPSSPSPRRTLPVMYRVRVTTTRMAKGVPLALGPPGPRLLLSRTGNAGDRGGSIGSREGSTHSNRDGNMPGNRGGNAAGNRGGSPVATMADTPRIIAKA